MIKQSREYKNKKKIQKATLSHLSLSPKNHGRQAAASARLARACQPAGEGPPPDGYLTHVQTTQLANCVALPKAKQQASVFVP
jgi:hypothetical protein